MTQMEPQTRIETGTASAEAPVLLRIDVDAVSSKAARSLYAGRQKIHPKLARGTFRSVKWLVMAVTLGIY